MKSTLNKVLVVLTVSALFAGNIDAAGQKRKQRGTMATKRSRQRNLAKVEMSKLDFFQLVKEYGDSSFGKWSEADRIAALEGQYGSLDKAPKNLKIYLLGSEKDKTSAFRSKSKESALKELAGKSTKEATDNLNEATKDLEANPDNEELQEKVAEQTGILASMTKTMEQYLSPGAVTAVKAAVGAGALAIAAYGATYAVDFAAGKLGYEYKGEGEMAPGARLRSFVGGKAGDIYEFGKEKLMTYGPSFMTKRIFSPEALAAAAAKKAAAEQEAIDKTKKAAEEQDKANKAAREAAAALKKANDTPAPVIPPVIPPVGSNPEEGGE